MATPANPAVLVRATYKALLREARRLTRDRECLSLVRPVDALSWGTGSYAPTEPPAALHAALFPGVDFDAAGQVGKTVFSGASVGRLVRAEYRRGGLDPRAALAAGGGGVDAALRHLATVNRLRASDACTTLTRTRFGDDVIIDVTLSTAFVPVMSAADMSAADCFPFAYRVTVKNSGAQAVQLLGRHWRFHDASATLVVEVPRGSPGVVGHTPVLQPGQAFTYTSGAQLPTPRGSMAGCFQMAVPPAAATGSELFDAHAASTPLCGPGGVKADALRATQHAEHRGGADAAHKDPGR